MIIVLSELFAFAFEAGFLYLTNRRLADRTGTLVVLSLLMNASSFFLGVVEFGHRLNSAANKEARDPRTSSTKYPPQ